MSALNEEEKVALHRLLDDHTFKKVMGIVAERASTTINNSVPAADMAYLLAYEKGIRDVPKLMRRLIATAGAVQSAPRARGLDYSTEE